MNPKTANEARLLFWPSCVMIVAGLLPAIKPFLRDKQSDWPEAFAVFGFFGGAAVLTAVSFRQVLQLRSISPSDDENNRCRIWTEKMVLVAVATICASLIVVSAQIAFRAIVLSELNVNAIEPVLLVVIIVCSTGYWTLLTRSIIGGILLTAAAQMLIYLLLVAFVRLLDRIHPGAPRLSHQPNVHFALSFVVAGVALGYANLMLRLSLRRFVSMELRSN